MIHKQKRSYRNIWTTDKLDQKSSIFLTNERYQLGEKRNGTTHIKLKYNIAFGLALYLLCVEENLQTSKVLWI